MLDTSTEGAQSHPVAALAGLANATLRGSLAVVASKHNRRISQLCIRDRGVLPIGLFCALPHVLFAPEGNWTGEEDAALAKIGRRRHVAMTVPDIFSLARVTAQTETLGILPDKFALSVASELGLNVFSLPFEIDPTPLHLYWHTRHSADAEHAWMRAMVLDLLEPLDSVRHPISLRPSGPSHQTSRKGKTLNGR